MIQEDAFMINHWLLSQKNTGHGLFNGNTIRPTYYTFLMYKNFGLQQIYASSGIPDVNIYAAAREDGSLTIMIVNLLDTEQHLPIQIEGGNPKEANTWLLDATHNAENLGKQDFPPDGILSLPAQSASLYIIEK